MGTEVNGVNYKWAPYNLGVHDGLPSSTGKYYAWGELTDKENYTNDTYDVPFKGVSGDDETTFPGYQYPDAYDTATANWGSDWKLPNAGLLALLLNNSTYSWDTVNGVDGIRLISNTTHNSLFFPFVGIKNGTTITTAFGTHVQTKSTIVVGLDDQLKGYYTTLDISRPSTSYPDGHAATGRTWRYYGVVIRPVSSTIPSGGGGVGGAVDLGLSVLWAETNLGASNSGEYGNYYAWGETSPKATYEYNNYTASVTANTLPAENDAATQSLGTSWRTPKESEWEELVLNTTATWDTVNGQTGMRYTASNGNSIFIPAAGYFNTQRWFNDDYGYYWSSSKHPTIAADATNMLFNNGEFNDPQQRMERFVGLPIRPVYVN